jgi:hypothetical protein
MWEVGMQCKALDEVRNDEEDLVGLRGNFELNWSLKSCAP